MHPRVIPVLLLRNNGLVKTIKFNKSNYIGDPINAIRIFNEKEVDELVFLDIDASKENREPPYQFLEEIASECFMPLSYGGGVKSLEQVRKLTRAGVEKIIINSACLYDLKLISSATNSFGSSTIIGSIDIKKNIWGKYKVYSHVDKKILEIDPIKHALDLQKAGVGEILINDVDRDGMMNGYNLSLLKTITTSLDVPVIACGGAGSNKDLSTAIVEGKVSAAAAGSMFVFHGKHKAVLITYPPSSIIKNLQIKLK